MNITCVIMAGGIGERFWPKSRIKKPKQCLSIFSEKSLIEETIDRLSPFVPNDRIFISTNKQVADLIKEKVNTINDGNYIIEPLRRNTAPCIGLSAIYVEKNYPNSIMIIVPSDHYIKDKENYFRHLEKAVEMAEKNIVLIGIKPTYASTALGYIRNGKIVDSNGIKVYEVEKFFEKPNIAQAKKFLRSGNYLWNSGMFICKTNLILDAIKKYIPDLHEGLEKIKKSDFDNEVMKNVFKNLKPESATSIDFGVMEKADNLYMVKGEFYWNDVGDWKAMDLVLNKDKDGNVIGDNVINIDSKNNIIFSDKLLTTIGVRDLIIIQDDDCVLVCDKERSQDVKKLLEKLDKKHL